MIAQELSIPATGRSPTLGVLKAEAPGSTSSAPVLFVHGYTSGAWQFADHVMPELAASGRTSYAVDLRGHGRSDGREDVREARFADYADDLRRAMDFVTSEEGRTPILIGHSLGSVLARDYASRHLVAGLGLVSFGDIRIGMKGFMEWMMRTYPFQGIAGMMTGGPSAMFAKFEPQYDVMYAGQPKDAVRDNVERLMAQPDSDKVFMELSKLTFGSMKAAAPVLVMAGDNDPIASTASVKALADAYGTKPMILTGQAHDLFAGTRWREPYEHLASWLDTID